MGWGIALGAREGGCERGHTRGEVFEECCSSWQLYQLLAIKVIKRYLAQSFLVTHWPWTTRLFQFVVPVWVEKDYPQDASLDSWR